MAVVHAPLVAVPVSPPVLSPVRCAPVLVEDDPAHAARGQELAHDMYMQDAARDAAARHVADVTSRAVAAGAACNDAHMQTQLRGQEAALEGQRARDARLRSDAAAAAVAAPERGLALARERAAEAAAALEKARARVPAADAEDAAARAHYRDMLQAAKWPRSWRKRVHRGKESVQRSRAGPKQVGQAEAAEAEAIRREEEANARVAEALAKMEAAGAQRDTSRREEGDCEAWQRQAEADLEAAEAAAAAARQAAAEAAAAAGAAERQRDAAESALSAAQMLEEAAMRNNEQAINELHSADGTARAASQRHADAEFAARVHAGSPRRHRIHWEPAVFMSPPPVPPVGHLSPNRLLQSPPARPQPSSMPTTA